MRTWLAMLAFAIGVFVSACGGGARETYEVEVTDVERSKSAIDLLSDDKLEDKKPVFDANLVDSRPFGPEGKKWQFNTSAAVIGLDIEDIGNESGFDKLYPNYAAAAEAFSSRNVLPSVNMIDGKAKQFDDGLYAALDLWQTQNKLEGVRDTRELCRELLNTLDSKSEAYAWVCAALLTGGFLSAEEATRAPERSRELRREFEQNETESKPIGFYTWNDELKRCFKFLRFLQQGFTERERPLAQVLADAIQANEQASQQYARMLSFYSKLTNPFAALTLSDLAKHPGKPLRQIFEALGMVVPAKGAMAHFLPYSSSAETELFDKLFPEGLPEGADLMLEFIKAIRSGKIDLKPRANSGWYDYQVYALETFLLPERGPESSKLLLSKKYKVRMLEAFKAMITKRRETHVRGIGVAGNTAASEEPPDGEVSPRLRVEPNPTFYLRTARAYAFLYNFLEAEAPIAIKRGYGLREDRVNKGYLAGELYLIRTLFYGLYMVSCEDIGLKEELLEGEVENRDYCLRRATNWLENWLESKGAKGSNIELPSRDDVDILIPDYDLRYDTRVAVPVFFDITPGAQKTRCWGTLGVRPVKLRAWYASAPKWRPITDDGKSQAAPNVWEEVPSYRLSDAHYIILTDEFGEFTLKGSRVLNRAEFRDFCDRGKNKADILAALNR
ncbi:hypothetical protein PLCT1_00722 [Planctomycetaceae bacterium]|nr:hypothetical protein PLCT1_00722 [Planctomycetaceae bacterium]